MILPVDLANARARAMALSVRFYRLMVYPDDLGDVDEPSRIIPNRFALGFPGFWPFGDPSRTGPPPVNAPGRNRIVTK